MDSNVVSLVTQHHSIRGHGGHPCRYFSPTDARTQLLLCDRDNSHTGDKLVLIWEQVAIFADRIVRIHCIRYHHIIVTWCTHTCIVQRMTVQQQCTAAYTHAAATCVCVCVYKEEHLQTLQTSNKNFDTTTAEHVTYRTLRLINRSVLYELVTWTVIHQLTDCRWWCRFVVFK